MADANDSDLMREYAGGNSAAFTRLVERHINFVYSAALRFTGNAPDAEDITQAVFIILARKISGLRQRASLTGWLYETTRFTARQWARSCASRQAREQEAYMDSLIQQSDTDPLWKQLAPVLEDAMARLSEKDRALLALRFFENKSVAETASLLGLNEWTVRKRAGRAVEKLRLFFSRRGVTVPASTLTSALSAHSIQAAPAGLVKTISAVALTKGVAASTSTLTLTKGALKLMAWTKTNIAISATVGVLFAAGVTITGVEEVRGHDTTPTAMPDTSGKPQPSTFLVVASEFVEVPDSLLDSLNLPWQANDNGSSMAVISAAQQANLLRTWHNNPKVKDWGAPRIALSPAPGSENQGSVSMTKVVNVAGQDQQIGPSIDVTTTMAMDSKSVDLKLDGELKELMGSALTGEVSTNAMAGSATLSLNPGQAMVIRSPLGNGNIGGDAVDTVPRPKSLLLLVTPKIQKAAVRLQKMLAPGPGTLTWTNYSTH